MPLLSCPKQEVLLEFASIPKELPFSRRLSLKAHVFHCAGCREALTQIQEKMARYFAPEPDITSSLMNVYSRLQQDETLILKGWKLDPMGAKPSNPRHAPKFTESWMFRGGLAATLAIALVGFLFRSNPIPGTEFGPVAQTKNTLNTSAQPFAQIRFENKDRLEVHYLEPELIHSMDFETTRVSHTR